MRSHACPPEESGMSTRTLSSRALSSRTLSSRTLSSTSFSSSSISTLSSAKRGLGSVFVDLVRLSRRRRLSIVLRLPSVSLKAFSCVPMATMS